MMKRDRKKRKTPPVPSIEQVEAELKRARSRTKYQNTLRSTAFIMIVAAACAILVATLLLPVLQIYGESMSPALREGDIVVSAKGSSFKSGEPIAFYIGNKLLVKRCIAGPGDWVDIDSEGNIYVNTKLLDEPYVAEKAVGECDITLPYQVPEDRWFVVGDHRATSLDSRSTLIGCISEEQIAGKLLFRIWPLNRAGKIN